MAIAVYVSFIKVGICRIVLTHRTSCSGVRACVTARSKGNGWGWAWKMKQEMIKMSRPIPHKTAMTGCRFIVLSLFSPLRVVATVGVCVPSGFVALYMAFFSSVLAMTRYECSALSIRLAGFVLISSPVFYHTILSSCRVSSGTGR